MEKCGSHNLGGRSNPADPRHAADRAIKRDLYITFIN